MTASIEQEIDININTWIMYIPDVSDMLTQSDCLRYTQTEQPLACRCYLACNTVIFRPGDCPVWRWWFSSMWYISRRRLDNWYGITCVSTDRIRTFQSWIILNKQRRQAKYQRGPICCCLHSLCGSRKKFDWDDVVWLV